MKQIALYRLTISLLTVALLMASVALWDAQKSLARERIAWAIDAAGINRHNPYLEKQLEYANRDVTVYSEELRKVRERMYEIENSQQRYIRDLEARLKAYEEAYPEPPAVKQVRQRMIEQEFIIPNGLPKR